MVLWAFNDCGEIERDLSFSRCGAQIANGIRKLSAFCIWEKKGALKVNVPVEVGAPLPTHLL